MAVRHLIGVLLLSSTGVFGGGAGYDALLAEAERVKHQRMVGESDEGRLNRAYTLLQKAAEVDPRRWEAWSLRGLIQCEKANIFRRKLATTLNDLRTRAAPSELLEATERDGNRAVDASLSYAHRDFSRMRDLMVASKQKNRNMVRFAVASMKFAAAEYLEGKHGEPGAIEDLEGLVRAKFRQELCSEMIAQCYVNLGVEQFTQENYGGAQRFWDKGLIWARKPGTRRVLYLNKAGGYQADNEYGVAERLLREETVRDPDGPGAWKNLGLVLGFQNRLREAVDAYREAREACGRSASPIGVGRLHGNAWLKAAMIHGKLLEEDGDLRHAWELFFQYRNLLGDDYNFCFNFGDFLASMRQYDLAWVFLERAATLQPFCPPPYQLLLQISARTAGTPDEVAQRVAEAQRRHDAVRARFDVHEESTPVKRLCGGLRDLSDGDPPAGHGEHMDPDPLAGYDALTPPQWLIAVADQRAPYRSFSPDQPEADRAEGGGAGVREMTPGAWVLAGILALVVAVILAFLSRRRAREPA